MRNILHQLQHQSLVNSEHVLPSPNIIIIVVDQKIISDN